MGPSSPRPAVARRARFTRAAAPAPLQPQRPRGGGRTPAADRPIRLRQAGKLQRRPPRGVAAAAEQRAAAPPDREQHQRGIRPGRPPRRPPEQDCAAAAVPATSACEPSPPGTPDRAARRRPWPPPPPGRPPEAARREAPAPAEGGAAGKVRLAAQRRAGCAAEAGGGAQVRGVGGAERGGAGVHDAVRQGEAGQGGGPRRAAGRPPPAHAVAGELRGRQATPEHHFLLKDVRVLHVSPQRLRRCVSEALNAIDVPCSCHCDNLFGSRAEVRLTTARQTETGRCRSEPFLKAHYPGVPRGLPVLADLLATVAFFIFNMHITAMMPLFRILYNETTAASQTNYKKRK